MEKMILNPKKYAVQGAKGLIEYSGINMGFETFSETFGLEVENDFARRLVASFNACKGIDTLLLETSTVEDTLNEAYTNRVKVERLEAKNAQLLEALIMAKEEIAVAIAKAAQSPETTTP